MFILFGTKDRAIETDSGQFHCPNCNVKKEYGKKYVQDFFTLFFIPIFPISGKKNDHIECKECQSIYHLDVIDYKPALNDEEMESEYQKALKNVLCLMILADNKVKDEEINKIELFVNSMVSKKSNIRTRLMTPDEAVENGALALFGEKYGDEVRVLSMGDDNGKYFSTELCGGTHVKNTSDIGKFKIISQSSIAAGVRRIEALRDKQLEDYLKNKEKLSNLSSEKNDELIKDLTKQIISFGVKPSLDQTDQKSLIKNLTKQLDTLLVKSILNNKTKNKIKDEEIKGIKVRFQNVDGLPPRELRKLVDNGKKDLGEGIVIVFASKDDKVGVAVGITDKLTNKFDAVKFVKLSSEIIGGQGGGGRKDFAQAGGQDQSKINEAFEKIKSLI